MILTAFCKYMHAFMSSSTVNIKNVVGSNVAVNCSQVRDNNCQFARFAYNMQNPRNQASLLNGSNSGVFFGTGDAAPAFEDYTLSGAVVEGITVTYTQSQEADGDAQVISTVYTIVNNNADAVTIREVLLVGYGQYTSGYTGVCAAIDRTLLDVPVTIEGGGGIGRVTYSIKIHPLTP